MPEATTFIPFEFDKTSPQAIYDYSRNLLGHSLHSLLGEKVIEKERKGKGRLGQMVEELFFGYDVNSNPEADFNQAHVELKCTPLLRSGDGESFRIKERLVCTMIDYFNLVDTSFEDSHLLQKCGLMLLLFYHHGGAVPVYDYEFLFRVLWQLPEKDKLQIKADYEKIAEKVRRGEAHLLSEGDTLYLGACRKGQKGDALQAQPNSEIKAKKRAFSLKPAYMRYILQNVIDRPDKSYTNFRDAEKDRLGIVSADDLKNKTFEQILTERFSPFIGKDYVEICDMLGRVPYQAKNKYADIAALIASDNKFKRLSETEEFIKSGITVKTVRLGENGMPKESMSFRNIDYQEVIENDEWIESDAYEFFTTRFMFVVFRPVPGRTITVRNQKTGAETTEQAYVLDRVLFWTMPPEDLDTAKEYWENIRENVINNNITLDAFWRLSDHRKFHVRPKAANAAQKAINPNGGLADKFCYWFNAEYVKQILDSNNPNG